MISDENARFTESAWSGFANALDLWEVEDGLRQRVRSSRNLGIFLDYDGTLTPIVSDPDKSFISEKMRNLIAKLSGQKETDVAIVSGRSISKLQHFLRLDSLHLSGSHGAEIFSPATTNNPHGIKMSVVGNLEELKQAEQEVHYMLDAYPGCQLENNKYVFSVHFRNAEFEKLPQNLKRVRERELEVKLKDIADRRNLRMGHGKKVFEIKPKGSWDKGAAVLWLIRQVLMRDCSVERSTDSSGNKTPKYDDVEELEEESSEGSEVLRAELPNSGHPFYIYLGDDRSDERAFAALKKNYPNHSLAILVSSRVRDTEANCWLRDPNEVYEFLSHLLRDEME